MPAVVWAISAAGATTRRRWLARSLVGAVVRATRTTFWANASATYAARTALDREVRFLILISASVQFSFGEKTKCVASCLSCCSLPLLLSFLSQKQICNFKINFINQQNDESFNQVSTRERCNMKADYGRCHGSQLRWHFDSRSEQCHSFLYSGCGGNPNRFDSHQACASVCGEVPRNHSSTPIPSGGAIEPYRISTKRPKGFLLRNAFCHVYSSTPASPFHCCFWLL